MPTSQFTQQWQQYEPLLKALVELFNPFLEVAVHDLEKGKIAAIYNNISQRQVGGASPLKEFKVKVEDFPDYFSPYYKQNWDGSPLKCTSITLRNQKGKPVGLICINVNVGICQEGLRLLQNFLNVKVEAENPVEIYGGAFEEQAEVLIQEYLDQKRLSLNRLKSLHKKELVQELFKKGLFNFKNAAPFIAKKLNASRGTIYNYIKLLNTR